MKNGGLQEAERECRKLGVFDSSLTRVPSRARGDGSHLTLVLYNLEKCQY